MTPGFSNRERKSVARHAREARVARSFCLRVGVLALLFAVASLSTLAKNSQYYPKDSRIQFVNIASKMKAAQPLSVADASPRHTAFEAIPPRPLFHLCRWAEPQGVPTQQIDRAISWQHSSPPTIRA